MLDVCCSWGECSLADHGVGKGVAAFSPIGPATARGPGPGGWPFVYLASNGTGVGLSFPRTVRERASGAWSWAGLVTAIVVPRLSLGRCCRCRQLRRPCSRRPRCATWGPRAWESPSFTNPAVATGEGRPWPSPGAKRSTPLGAADLVEDGALPAGPGSMRTPAVPRRPSTQLREDGCANWSFVRFIFSASRGPTRQADGSGFFFRRRGAAYAEQGKGTNPGGGVGRSIRSRGPPPASCRSDPLGSQTSRARLARSFSPPRMP